jgi:threonine dehydratase
LATGSASGRHHDIEAAVDRIAGHVLRTPTVFSPGLSDLLGVP